MSSPAIFPQGFFANLPTKNAYAFMTYLGLAFIVAGALYIGQQRDMVIDQEVRLEEAQQATAGMMEAHIERLHLIEGEVEDRAKRGPQSQPAMPTTQRLQRIADLNRQLNTLDNLRREDSQYSILFEGRTRQAAYWQIRFVSGGLVAIGLAVGTTGLALWLSRQQRVRDAMLLATWQRHQRGSEVPLQSNDTHGAETDDPVAFTGVETPKLPTNNAYVFMTWVGLVLATSLSSYMMHEWHGLVEVEVRVMSGMPALVLSNDRIGVYILEGGLAQVGAQPTPYRAPSVGPPASTASTTQMADLASFAGAVADRNAATLAAYREWKLRASAYARLQWGVIPLIAVGIVVACIGLYCWVTRQQRVEDWLLAARLLKQQKASSAKSIIVAS